MGFNEAAFILFLLVDMSFVVLMYRLFGREGLYGYLVLAIVACNIAVLKLVPLFGMTVTLGNILYGSVFLTCDILAEVYGKREAHKAVRLGFCALVLMTIFMQLVLRFQPAAFDSAQPHLQAIFGFLPRIAAGSLLAYIISQSFDVWLFLQIKDHMQGRALWLRNNVSVILSQALDTGLFVLIALAPLPGLGSVPGFESWGTVLSVAATTYVIKLIVSIADTPFVYWARAIGQRHYPPEQPRAREVFTVAV